MYVCMSVCDKYNVKFVFPLMVIGLVTMKIQNPGHCMEYKSPKGYLIEMDDDRIFDEVNVFKSHNAV